MIEVTFKADLSQGLDALARVGLEMKDLRGFFEEDLDPKITEFFIDQFTSAGQAGGEPWAPNRPSTVAIKGHGDILRQTDNLMESYINPDSTDAVREITEQNYVRGSRVPFAFFHQEGFRIDMWGSIIFGAPIDVPARKVIPDELPAALIEQGTEALDVRLKKAWEGQLKTKQANSSSGST